MCMTVSSAVNILPLFLLEAFNCDIDFICE